MKVADLISDSIWLPNPARTASACPAVSVLLPTYRRARDGSLTRAVRGVLDQELRDLELIIVDDGSTDGSADLIAEFMREDPRVHCIRHPLNIGLPAISEFEAFQRARADYIAFAFDDDVFTHAGLARLLDSARANGSMCVHGYCSYGVPTGDGLPVDEQITLGRRDGVEYTIPEPWLPPPHLAGSDARCLWALHVTNFIGNSSVLVHRHVLETVGLYDPHVIMIRSCDWDLWKRIIQRFPVAYVDVQVSFENSDTRADTLGRTVSIDLQRDMEYSARDRNDRLVPDAFPDFDVLNVIGPDSGRLRAYARSILAERQRDGHLQRLPRVARAKRIVFLYDQGPATHLLFHQLPAELRDQFFVHHGLTAWDPLWPLFANASAVVISDAAAFARLGIAAELRELDLPIYYYGADGILPEDLAATLPGVKGVLMPTAEGVARAKAFDGAVFEWPLSADSEVIDTARARPQRYAELAVGIVGATSAADAVALTLQGLRPRFELPVALIGRPGLENLLATNPADAIVAKEMGWAQLVEEWRRYGIDVLFIARGAAPETAFEGHAALLLACIVGAVPVVVDIDVLPGLHDAQGVVRTGPSEEELKAILLDLASGKRRARLHERLREHCRLSYSARRALAAAQALLDAVPAVDLLVAEDRWRRLERLRTRTIVAQHDELERLRARCEAFETVAGTEPPEAPPHEPTPAAAEPETDATAEVAPEPGSSNGAGAPEITPHPARRD